MKDWFTADPHYGHANIIKYADRPFASVEEMDAFMIGQHNAVVAKSDRVWCVGDFAFADHLPYLARLNGEMHLIKGNHDHSNRVGKASGCPGGWASVSDLKYLKMEDDTQLVLFHYGMRVWKNSHHGVIHLYGHSHGNLPGDSQSCDVGVDVWNFQPIDIHMIRMRLATLPQRTEPDHHQPKSLSAA